MTTAKPVLHHVSLKKTPIVIPANKFDDETMEDEHNLPTVDIKKSSHVAHMSVSQLKLQEQVRLGAGSQGTEDSLIGGTRQSGDRGQSYW